MDVNNIESIEVERDSLVLRSPGEVHEIPLKALATYAELLGYSCPYETLDALLHIGEHGEPDPDPETGDNVWTDSYLLLAHRENAREEEFIQAQEEGRRDDPRSPELRSTLAAYNAVHIPVDGGECVMDRCRRGARSRLGLKDPSKNVGSTSRVMSTRSASRAASRAPDLQARLQETIEPRLGAIEKSRRQFLASLNGRPVDPLEPEEVKEPVDPIQATMSKYGGRPT